MKEGSIMSLQLPTGKKGNFTTQFIKGHHLTYILENDFKMHE